ncbi:protein kinase, partial [Escherichia coli]|nr:protein kinase [Escherichia coli]
TLRLLVAPEVALFRACATDQTLNALYLVTEYVAGQSLANRINGLPVPVEDVLVLLRRVATGLKAAHDLNIIHRDISPDNILLPERRFDLAKIIDF